MTNRNMILIEGLSDVTALNAQDRTIATATAHRRVFSLLHELAHGAIDGADAHRMDMWLFLQSSHMLQGALRLIDMDWRRELADICLPSGERLYIKCTAEDGKLPSAETASVPLLPEWYHDALADMGAGMRAAAPGGDSVADRAIYPVYRLAGACRWLDDRSWLQRLSARCAVVVRVLDHVIGALHVMRMHIRASLNGRPIACPFVLLLLAVCRRYGRRSEPGDHVSLLTSRNLSVGSCPSC